MSCESGGPSPYGPCPQFPFVCDVPLSVGCAGPSSNVLSPICQIVDGNTQCQYGYVASRPEPVTDSDQNSNATAGACSSHSRAAENATPTAVAPSSIVSEPSMNAIISGSS